MSFDTEKHMTGFGTENSSTTFAAFANIRFSVHAANRGSPLMCEFRFFVRVTGEKMSFVVVMMIEGHVTWAGVFTGQHFEILDFSENCCNASK